MQGFYHCLDIWTTFLDYLTEKIQSSKGKNGINDNNYQKYVSFVESLVALLHIRCQAFSSILSTINELVALVTQLMHLSPDI